MMEFCFLIYSTSYKRLTSSYSSHSFYTHSRTHTHTHTHTPHTHTRRVSHLPPSYTTAARTTTISSSSSSSSSRVAGLGMNAEELKLNPQLTEYVQIVWSCSCT